MLVLRLGNMGCAEKKRACRDSESQDFALQGTELKLRPVRRSLDAENGEGGRVEIGRGRWPARSPGWRARGHRHERRSKVKRYDAYLPRIRRRRHRRHNLGAWVRRRAVMMAWRRTPGGSSRAQVVRACHGAFDLEKHQRNRDRDHQPVAAHHQISFGWNDFPQLQLFFALGLWNTNALSSSDSE